MLITIQGSGVIGLASSTITMFINIINIFIIIMMRKTMVTQLELIAIQGRGVGGLALDGQSDRNKIELRLKDTKIRRNKSQLKWYSKLRNGGSGRLSKNNCQLVSHTNPHRALSLSML